MKKKVVRKVPFKSKRKGVYGKKRTTKIVSKKNIYNGIAFKSMLESYFYKTVIKYFPDLEYEPESYVVFEGFKFQNSTVRSISYTPDFRSKTGKFIVETKGWANDAFPLRLKMFKKYMNDNKLEYTFYLLRNQQEINNFISVVNKKEVNSG